MTPPCVEFEILDDVTKFHCIAASVPCTRESAENKHMIYPYGTPSPTIAST